MTSSARMLQFIEFKGIKKSNFYKQVGLSNGYLDKVLELGSDKIESILKFYPDLNVYWLVTGEGEMLLDLAQTSLNMYKHLPQALNQEVNADQQPYNANYGKNECAKLIENYQLLLDQKDILINELKLLLEANRNAVKFSKVEQ
jgi:hypothetical protein